ncbi:MAG TPA: DUF72 domain-containing protein [Planctomycetota bacterium]|jgi:uncharacterized protein YecE (DUF72 family)|nr:DUF72 domain-containing protein [Planctomycetota bacterium]
MLRLGTSSWSEKGWIGPFYPPGTKPADFLSFYATRFDTVEADTTYYRVPDRDLVRGWSIKTPERFLLAAKFPRSIVHCGETEKPDAARVLCSDVAARDTERFLETMATLGPKCGPLVLQFPYFNQSAFAGLGAFLDRLDPYLERLPKTFRYGVEVRNKSWITPELTDVLRRHRVALVLVDLAYMPHPADLAASMDLVTADFLYVRLIGDRKAVEEKTKTFDRVVLDQGARLDRWAELIKTLSVRVPETSVYANNHYAGFAPATVRDLMRRLGVGDESDQRVSS